jgi:putative tryptophan/tyrosine transport system substrate-binding protein
MRRREFISLLGGAAASSVSWPLAARAQQPAMPVVGFLHSATAAPFVRHVAAFRNGMGENGYVEGRNATIEYRWAEGQYDRLPALAADLVARQVAVLVALGPAASLIAKAATPTIPVVFSTGDDPVKVGLVTNLSRPEGNVTGIHIFTGELEPKRLGLLSQMVPQARLLGLLVNSGSPQLETLVKDARAAAAAIGRQILVVTASSEHEFEAAFATVAQGGAGALLVANDIFFNSMRDVLVALAARYKVPAIYEFREFAAAGGLMSYGTSLPDVYRQAGVYAGKILKGSKPADLPVFRLSRFEFVINLNTAKALGIDLPPGLSAMADEIIE